MQQPPLHRPYLPPLHPPPPHTHTHPPQPALAPQVGRTVIVIAHRLSTVVNADRIVVVDDNAIVDVGTHQELLGRCAKYEELVRYVEQTGLGSRRYHFFHRCPATPPPMYCFRTRAHTTPAPKFQFAAPLSPLSPPTTPPPCLVASSRARRTVQRSCAMRLAGTRARGARVPPRPPRYWR